MITRVIRGSTCLITLLTFLIIFPAKLMGACWADSVIGVRLKKMGSFKPADLLGIKYAGILEPGYSVSIAQKENEFHFNLSQKDKNIGKLIFVATDYEEYRSDMRWILNKSDYSYLMGENTLDTFLYKEFRIKGILKSDKKLASSLGLSPNQEGIFTLIGKGNNCTAASDFHHWILDTEPHQEIEGRGALGYGKISG